MRIFFFILSILWSLNFLIANDNFLSVKSLLVMKRNQPQCDRLGNIYDSCQWMLKFEVINNTSYNLKSFCSIIKINKKKYELCSQEYSNSYYIKSKDSKVILSNLSKLIGYKNDDPKPVARIISIKGNYSKDKP